MTTMTLTNPKTNRKMTARLFDVDNKAMTAFLVENQGTVSARDMGLKILSDAKTQRAMARTMGGESARTNLALNVLENALDWSLGLAVLKFRMDCRRAKKQVPEKFQVAASAKGDVFVVINNERGQHVLPY